MLVAKPGNPDIPWGLILTLKFSIYDTLSFYNITQIFLNEDCSAITKYNQKYSNYSENYSCQAQLQEVGCCRLVLADSGWWEAVFPLR